MTINQGTSIFRRLDQGGPYIWSFFSCEKDEINYKSSPKVKSISSIINYIKNLRPPNGYYRQNEPPTRHCHRSTVASNLTLSMTIGKSFCILLWTNTLETQSSPLNPCIDLKHQTPNLVTWRETLTLPSKEDNTNLHRSSVDYVQPNEIEEDLSSQDKLEVGVICASTASVGPKNTNLKYSSEDTNILTPPLAQSDASKPSTQNSVQSFFILAANPPSTCK